MSSAFLGEKCMRLLSPGTNDEILTNELGYILSSLTIHIFLRGFEKQALANLLIDVPGVFKI